MRAISLLGLAVVTSCASAPPTATAPPVASEAPVVADAGPAPVATQEPEAEPKRQRPPVEVVNLCHDVALLAYGEPPNFKTESLGRFMADATGTAPRERDGTLAVTLVDDKGNALAKVSVSRHMKKLEIGRSCRTLFAH
jgi:hypothetical protein